MILRLSNSKLTTFIDDHVGVTPFRYTLTNGVTRVIIPADAAWRLSTLGYACTRVGSGGKYHVINLHRLVTGNIKGILVDHINHNKLDNSLANLRLVSPSQNGLNRSKISGQWTSMFKGVRLRRGKYIARITHRRKEYHLGTFVDEKDAAMAYDAKLKELDPTAPVYAFNNP